MEISQQEAIALRQTIDGHVSAARQASLAMKEARLELDRLNMTNKQLAAALHKAAEKFREYERLHRAKPDDVKADRNAEMAMMCEAALIAFKGDYA